MPFEAFANSEADEGSDLLDIGGKVRSISVLNSEAADALNVDLTLDKAKANDLVLGSIGDPEEVERLVRGLMEAPLEPTPIDYYASVDDAEAEQTHYFIVFHLEDGAAVARDYRTDSGRLTNTYSAFGAGDPPMTSGIVTPLVFRDAIKEAALPDQREEELESPPDGTLSYGGREFRSLPQAPYCWGGGCADGLPAAPSRSETLYVPYGSEMVFRYEGQSPPNKVTATAARPYEGRAFSQITRGPSRSLEVHGSGVKRSITAEVPPGEYLVLVDFKARQAELYYIFRVVVP